MTQVASGSDLQKRIQAALGAGYEVQNEIGGGGMSRVFGARDVALIPAGELAGLMETAHLLRSPRNAQRLLASLHRAGRGKAKPSTVAELRREIIGGTGT